MTADLRKRMSATVWGTSSFPSPVVRPPLLPPPEGPAGRGPPLPRGPHPDVAVAAEVGPAGNTRLRNHLAPWLRNRSACRTRPAAAAAAGAVRGTGPQQGLGRGACRPPARGRWRRAGWGFVGKGWAGGAAGREASRGTPGGKPALPRPTCWCVSV